ncbi:MAG TPA: DUF4276 family protein [Thermoanaerobaculia bacterium]|nr:DUF4276 family protein [Thermoanaerobaculia bacterium]
MRLGFVVDGEAEYRSLPRLFASIGVNNVLLTPLKADIQPLAPIGQIAASVKPAIKILMAKRVDRAIVLLDRETRDECPGGFAASLADTLARVCPGPSFDVVVKNRQFENWLVADPDALSAQIGRFRLTDGQRRQIVPNKADTIDALALLKIVVRQHDYEKVKDAVRIMSHATAANMAENSRSFRRFLRVVGHPAYSTQSRRPA